MTETKARSLENTEVELEPNTAAFYAVLTAPSSAFDAALQQRQPYLPEIDALAKALFSPVFPLMAPRLSAK